MSQSRRFFSAREPPFKKVPGTFKSLEKLKAWVKRNCLFCVFLAHKVRRLHYRLRSIRSKFGEYHRQGVGGQISVSGPGSDLKQTAAIQKTLPLLLKEFHVRTILDAPCGDFFWMKDVALDIDRYIGVDIIEELIQKNQKEFGKAGREFYCLDCLKDSLPFADLILCRDLLVHLSFKDIYRTLRNFKKGQSRFLLTTTFTKVQKNEDILTGDWRPLNLELSPFHFPKPLKLIEEGCTENEGRYSDKSLGLWKLDRLTI